MLGISGDSEGLDSEELSIALPQWRRGQGNLWIFTSSIPYLPFQDRVVWDSLEFMVIPLPHPPGVDHHTSLVNPFGIPTEARFPCCAKDITNLILWADDSYGVCPQFFLKSGGFHCACSGAGAFVLSLGS